jgi:hypothetical protein
VGAVKRGSKQTTLPGSAAPDSLGSVDSLLGIPAGLALSSAAGLRVFVPLMLTSAAARFGYIALSLLGLLAPILGLAAVVVLLTALVPRLTRVRGRHRTRAA